MVFVFFFAIDGDSFVSGDIPVACNKGRNKKEWKYLTFLAGFESDLDSVLKENHF